MLKKLLTSKGTIYLVYSSFLLSPKTYKSISNISLYNSLVLGITFATVACRLFKRNCYFPHCFLPLEYVNAKQREVTVKSYMHFSS